MGARVDRRWRARWESANPVLGDGELGLEINTNRMKVGDGKTPWNSLSWLPNNQTIVGGTFVPDGYATEDYVNQAIDAIPEPDLSGFATKQYVQDSQPDLTGFATRAQIPDITPLATKTFVQDEIDAIPAPDLTGLATKGYVDDAIEAIPAPNLTGLATESFVAQEIGKIPAPDLSGYATKQYVDNAISQSNSSGSRVAEDEDGVPYYT